MGQSSLVFVTLARPKSQAMLVIAHNAASAISGSCSHILSLSGLPVTGGDEGDEDGSVL